MISTLLANYFIATKGKIMLYVKKKKKKPSSRSCLKDILFIYCDVCLFVLGFFLSHKSVHTNPNVMKISNHIVLYFLGKSDSLFWPHLPSTNRKLHAYVDFLFGRKIFCCCVSIRTCMLALEKRQMKVITWTEGFLSPRHKSSVEIKHHHLFQSLLSCGGAGLSPRHPWRPPCPQTSEFWSSGNEIRAGYPTG